MDETSADISPVCMAGGPDLRRTGSNCSTWPRYPSRGTATAAPPWTVADPPRCRGEPAAWKHARRVRRAAWGNGLMATPGTAPRADSTKGKEANLAIIRPARSAASRTVKGSGSPATQADRGVSYGMPQTSSMCAIATSPRHLSKDHRIASAARPGIGRWF